FRTLWRLLEKLPATFPNSDFLFVYEPCMARRHNHTPLIDHDECNREWLLKNSFLQNSQKQNCARMRYERSSPIARHFLSPKFWRFEAKCEFFNSHRRLHSKPMKGGTGS